MERMRGAVRSDDVVAKIRSDIAEGVYRPGDQLPGPDELAGELRKLAKAVESAYRQLIEEGTLVESLVRPGVFVADPEMDPDIRTLVRVVRGMQHQLARLEDRLEDLTERVRAAERGVREVHRQGGGYDHHF